MGRDNSPRERKEPLVPATAAGCPVTKSHYSIGRAFKDFAGGNFDFRDAPEIGVGPCGGYPAHNGEVARDQCSVSTILLDSQHKSMGAA